MVDFAAARRHMVEGQIRTSDITELRLVSAMLELPRERFLPPKWQPLAYADRALPLTDGAKSAARWMVPPMVLGKLIQAADIQAGDKVLHVGAGSGYGTAVLARLGASVVALEDDPALLDHAREVLAALDLAGVEFVSGPLTEGCPDHAPYDAVLIEGAVEFVPDGFASQLTAAGRLVAIVGLGRAGQGVVLRRVGDVLSGATAFDAAAPLLPAFTRPPAFVF